MAALSCFIHSLTKRPTMRSSMCTQFLWRQKFAGHVAVVRVDDNQLVKKAMFWSRSIRAISSRIGAGQSEPGKRQGHANTSRINEKRALDLFNRKVISTQERDTNVATAESSRASVQADEAAVEQTELNLATVKSKRR